MLARLLVLFSLLTLAPAFSRPGLLGLAIEINSSFPYIHFFIAIIVLPFLYRERKGVWILAGCVSLALQTVQIFWPIFNQKPEPEISSHQIKILYANVYVYNHDTKRFRTLIESQSPDLVFITEVSQDWLDKLAIQDLFPYSFLRPGVSADGNAIYSKFPLSSMQRLPEYSYFAALIADVELEQNFKFQIAIIHAPPPPSDPGGLQRTELVKLLAKNIHDDQHAVVIGDLNTSTSNPRFRERISFTGLNIVSGKWRILPTWHSLEIPGLYSAIDHLLVGEKVFSQSYEVGPDIGSDHFPIIAKLKFTD